MSVLVVTRDVGLAVSLSLTLDPPPTVVRTLSQLLDLPSADDTSPVIVIDLNSTHAGLAAARKAKERWRTASCVVIGLMAAEGPVDPSVKVLVRPFDVGLLKDLLSNRDVPGHRSRLRGFLGTRR